MSLPDYARNTLIRAYQAARVARFQGTESVPAIGPAQSPVAPEDRKRSPRPEFGPTRPDHL